MANLEYTTDLLADILDRGDEPLDATGEYYAQTLTWLNRQYRALWMGGSEIDPSIHEAWWWLQAHPPGVLLLDPPRTEGAAVVVQGSPTVVLTHPSPVSLTGWHFQVSPDGTVYRIETHTAGSASATLDSPFTGLTGAEYTYTLLHTVYELAAGAWRLTGPMTSSQRTMAGGWQIVGMDGSLMDSIWPPIDMPTGVPDAFTIGHQAMTGRLTVRFNRGGLTNGQQLRLTYEYLIRPPMLTALANEEPVVPWEYRQVLVEATLYLLYMAKNDSRADAAGLAAKAGLAAMARENRIRRSVLSPDVGKIFPRPQAPLFPPGVWIAR